MEMNRLFMETYLKFMHQIKSLKCETLCKTTCLYHRNFSRIKSLIIEI